MDRVQNQVWFQASMGDLEHDPHKEVFYYSPRVKLSKLCVLVFCGMALITEKKQYACWSHLKSRACAGNLYSPR